MSTGQIVTIVVIVIIILVLLAIFGMMASRRRKRQQEELRDRFGPEYDRTVEQTGKERQADKLLRERAERRDKLQIRDLEPAVRVRYQDEWQSVQARFVDDPTGAINAADALVGRVMRDRGYPVDDFDTQAEMISVDHPDIVENYRRSREIKVESDRGQATTEAMRRAFVHYRALFDNLLGTGGAMSGTMSGSGTTAGTADAPPVGSTATTPSDVRDDTIDLRQGDDNAVREGYRDDVSEADRARGRHER
ncbi:MAG: hypothetical protein ACTHMW_11685 [Actinomycetes bacterium]